MESGVITADLDNFMSTARQEVLSAREALLNSDADQFSNIMSRLASHESVKLIINKASLSISYFDDLSDRFKRAAPAMKIIVGLSIVGAGAVIWGVKFALAPIIAFCLIVYGASIAVPAAFELVAVAANDYYERVMMSE
jgi:hypothetical protein